MKKLLLFVLLACSVLSTQAQYFGLESSVWKYNYWGVGIQGEYVIQFDHDTVLQGYEAKVFKNHRSEFLPQQDGSYLLLGYIEPYATLRSSNDSVFWWKSDQWLLLYDFGAQVGDTWVADIDPLGSPICGDTLVVEVVGVGVTTLNGQSKNYIDLETISSSGTSLSGRSVEVVGLLEHDPGSGQGHIYAGFIPGPSDCIPPIVSWYQALPLCHYEDSVVGVMDSVAAACNDIQVGVLELSELNVVTVQPNPSDGHFTILLPSSMENANFEILDMQGRVVLSRSQPVTRNLQPEIDLTQHPKGLYLVRLSTGKEVFTTRIIKQ